MKTVSNQYKLNIKDLGRIFDVKITYTLNNSSVVLDGENLNKLSLITKGAILKSSMKELEIDSNVAIPVNAILNFQFGLLVNNDFEYIDYGDFIVYQSERQEDLRSYKLKCYDKMLYTMIPYENVSFTFPCTIREYFQQLCTHLQLQFANDSDNFANYDKVLDYDYFLDENGNSLGYTFRNVFDQLAEVTASTIIINKNNQVEIKYINDTHEIIDEESFKDINVNFSEQFGPVNTIALSRSADSDVVYYPDPLPQNPIEVKISDNQIMNDDNRSQYLPDIYNKLNGLTYFINDYESPGITYFDLCDKYVASIDEQQYQCILFNDELEISQGISERIYTDKPIYEKPDYTSASKTDILIKRTSLIVNKQEGKIEALTSTVDEQNSIIESVKTTQDSQQLKIDVMSTNIDETGEVTSVKTTEGFTFNNEGLNITKSDTTYNTQINNEGTYYKDGTTIVAQTTKDGSKFKDMDLFGTYRYGKNSIDDEPMFIAQLYRDRNNEECFGHFYNGG